ncbi:MAG TPA: Asp23/Gls24 family envelope stress response protein [Candidatus Stercoripulliclostridium merdigallinarum]|uniref:Asp23/Gls24 family envelope stress response protein n=1 Tax=Candidatus Stercoripulliclostridium merdigallinarum TaxID=2840951 RepID=A0A9D1SH51_9FIRM|nr:Asp23/Gls24 family envelope stress response protein [Candidatus Stercoripulliclostridium merdigallinarum]
MWYYNRMESLKPQVVEQYSSLIASIANEAFRKVEGITMEEGVQKYRFGLRKLRNTNCHVYILDADECIIDIFVNVDFGYSIPETVCQLQETIKNDVEEATKFKVKKVNVTVANINI